jgi:hypothetical protein
MHLYSKMCSSLKHFNETQHVLALYRAILRGFLVTKTAYNLQNMYRFRACNKIKQIQNTTSTNTLHKRQNYITKQIKEKLEHNNLTITKADKGKTIVIIDKNTLIQKTEEFLRENQFKLLPKDATNKYQKQLQQALSNCNKVIDKQQRKYLLEIKPKPPTLNVQLKIHKENEPIRPVVNNIQTPSYKTAKFLNKWLTDQLSLSNTYTTYNSTHLANNLIKLKISDTTRMITLDMKDLYVNIPIDETITIMKNQPKNKKLDNGTIEQARKLLETILRQNYLQFNSKFFQPQKDVAMGSPISRLVSEIFLQCYENLILKNTLETKKIIFYNRYVDDILIIYDEHLINTNSIQNYMDNIHPDLQFKATNEKDSTINFMELSITREKRKLDINIYRKPTTTDTTIHYKSNHPIQYKMAAYRFMLNRLHSLPLSPEHKNLEMNTITQIAKQNGYPINLIQQLDNQIKERNP